MLQRRAKVTGKKPPLFHQLYDIFPFDLLCLQIFFHQRFITKRQAFLPFLRFPVFPEIHAAVTKFLSQLLQQPGPVGSFLIHLVDEKERGNPIPVQQLPQSRRVPLNPVSSVDHQHRIVQHRERSLHLRRKIHMSRSVQQSDIQILPGKPGLLGEDGNPPGTLQIMSVQECILVVHPPRPADAAAYIKKALRQGSFARVHVGENAQCNRPFSIMFRRIFHENTPFCL